MQNDEAYYSGDDLEKVDFHSKFVYSTGLLYAAEILLKRASIYLEDKELADEIDAHLERIERFYNDVIEEYKQTKHNVQKDN